MARTASLHFSQHLPRFARPSGSFQLANLHCAPGLLRLHPSSRVHGTLADKCSRWFCLPCPWNRLGQGVIHPARHLFRRPPWHNQPFPPLVTKCYEKCGIRNGTWFSAVAWACLRSPWIPGKMPWLMKALVIPVWGAPPIKIGTSSGEKISQVFS